MRIKVIVPFYDKKRKEMLEKNKEYDMSIDRINEILTKLPRHTIELAKGKKSK